jgi:guanosine-3',5'-bis(diphosphate) 3'-pyrophosphohydrolase
MKTASDIQAIYQEAILFAAGRHAQDNQTLPDSDIPYVVHLSNVCMEILIAGQHTDDFNWSLAVQSALLHDVLEDTDTTESEIEVRFGATVTQSVIALTKNEALPKAGRLPDSLRRIKECPNETWAVKLADRITNLQKPPRSWSSGKIAQYRKEAELILEELKDGNRYLAERLVKEIKTYGKYVECSFQREKSEEGR